MRRIGLILFCIAVSSAIAFVSLGDRLLDNHETFVSVTAREMSQNNEYIIPTFNGQNRLNKTPLPYWLVVAASQFTGKIDEFTARVPTAIMSVLSVICMLYFVSVLLDFRTAFLASMLWSCSLGYIRYSHCARPEMALTFFTLICFLSFYSAIEEANRKKRIFYSLIFWISFGLSVLAKAPASIFFIVLSAIVYLTVFRKWRQFPKILPIWGFILFLLIVLPWPIAAANAMNWDMSLWQNESVGRFTADSYHGYQKWFYYISKMFQFILPWVCFLPFAILAPFFKVWAEKRRLMWYLWICIFTGVVFLTFCGGKRQHYILPLMPLAAILVGVVMEDMVFSRKAYGQKEGVNVIKWHLMAFFVLGMSILILSSEPAYDYWGKLVGSIMSHGDNKGAELPPYNGLFFKYCIAGGSALILGTVVSFLLAVKNKPKLACMTIFSSMAIVIVLAVSLISSIPGGDEGSEAKFALELKNIIPHEDNVFAYGRMNSVFIHYFGRPIRTVSETEIEGLYNDDHWLIVLGEKVDEIRKGFSFREVKAYTVNGPEGQLIPIVIVHKKDLSTN